MAIDYYSLLTNAVAGKDASARSGIYKDALALVARSRLSPEAAASHTAALNEAIQRVEDDIATQGVGDDNEVAVKEVLQTGRNWKPLIVSVCAVLAVIAASILIYRYVQPDGLRAGLGISASSSKSARGHIEPVMPDLKPGVDGGSTGESLPFALQRQVVFYRTTVVPGSIVIDREKRFLYLIHSNNSARRYGIGVAQECLKRGSFFHVVKKLEWPDWQPSGTNTKDADALLEAAGRPGSPLGARALLMDQPWLFIHGTNSPQTIGHLVSSGCIRLVNADVEDLYRRVSLETRVIFIS